LAALVIQAIWITIGQITGLDPYPFTFMLTCSNIFQLMMIFIVAVAQRQSSEHASILIVIYIYILLFCYFLFLFIVFIAFNKNE
jgi:hypothetical protein